MKRTKLSITRQPNMTEKAFRAYVIDGLNSIGFEEYAIDNVVRNMGRVHVGDTLVFDFTRTESRKTLHVIRLEDYTKTLEGHNQVPYVARLALCLFVARQNQAPTLGDFEEKLNQIWIPTCGPRVGRLVCTWHAVWSASAMFRIGVMTAIVDCITRAIGR